MNNPIPPNSENVVPLNPRRRQASNTVSLARLPAAMHSVRDKARRELQELLRSLFDKADDALFDLADQATSNQEQNLYFDSMRQVRLQRRAIEQAFFHRLDQGFAQLLDPNAGPGRDGNSDVSLDELTLVQNDELEQLVATESMVNKVNEQHAEPLQHLVLRMDQLVPVKVYQRNNPVGPEAICNGFTEAAEQLTIDVKAKLVLFKLFDKWVASGLGKLYQSLNQLLVDANILPSLKIGAPRNRERGDSDTAYQRASQERERRGDESDQVLHTLRGLLSEQEKSQQRSGGDHGADEELSREELVRLLSQAQQSDWGAAESDDDAPVKVQQLVRGWVQGSRGQSLNRVDDDVINLVGMMFEFILDDRNLAPPMKALLGRLQIPLVKVAVVDKSFFSKGGHPARRLLNELAMAALGWQDGGEESRRKDSLYREIEKIVQSILTEFDSDVGIFEQMLVEFRTYQEKERRRAKILEQRTLDAEDGKARAERARAEVDASLARLVGERELPPAAHDLLYDAWSKVLFIICLKQGTQSKDWANAIRVADRLVWSSTVSMNRENRQKLLKMVPELLPQLRTGLESIAFNPYEMTQLFKQLETLHLTRLRVPGKASALEEGESGAGAEATEAEVSGTPGEADAEPETTTPVEPVDEAKPSFQVIETPEPAEPSPPEPAASAASGGPEAPTESTEPEGPLPASDPHMALVGNLTQGSWFEMQDGEGQMYRCRLAAMIKPTGKYIFVNRSGMKVAEETREGLARALKSGRLRLLDDGMLFDRALEAVIGNLRSSRSR